MESEPRLFPKPSPAAPLEEAAWLRRTDRAEVGREPFYFGCDTEYEVFRNAAVSLRSGQIGGGTMIFQGAPGAGKSALMQECMEAVRQHSMLHEPWVAVSVSPGDLRSPAYVMSALIRATDRESRRLARVDPSSNTQSLEGLRDLGKRVLQELSDRGFKVAGISVGGKSQAGKRSEMEMSTAELFHEAAFLLEGIRFVVFVDEAQNTPVESATTAVLDCLHRDSQGIHLVTAFFGLGDTEEVLSECGLSRIRRGRVMNLEPLPLADAASSFRRMLDTYYTGSEEEKSTWSDALADLSQGWPQHISGIGVAAGAVIRAAQGKLALALLETALKQGVAQKNEYYAKRLRAGKNPPWVYRQIALAAAKKQGDAAGIVTYEEICNLTESVRKMQGQTMRELITAALHAGLLATVDNLPFHYRFPIPSLGDYLRSLPVLPPDSA